MMQNDNSHGSCASVTRGFIALFAMMSMGLALAAYPAKSAPFAYVANESGFNVSVIDTVANKVVANVDIPPISTIGCVVEAIPIGVAVTPDGAQVYVASSGEVVPNPPFCCDPSNPCGPVNGAVFVIDTARNTVVGTPIPVGR
jgi:DNA-binding beta-propeller fold protein YncE